jgi:hypothetical protein
LEPTDEKDFKLKEQMINDAIEIVIPSDKIVNNNFEKITVDSVK